MCFLFECVYVCVCFSVRKWYYIVVLLFLCRVLFRFKDRILRCFVCTEFTVFY